MSRALTALVAVVAVIALLPAVASAHAMLESTTPARGQALDSPPREVVLDFNEPVEAAFGAVRVFDAKGEAVQAGEPFRPGGRADRVGVQLPGGLARGGYTVTYRVISADSHPISGGFVFTYRSGSGPAATVDELLAGTGTGAVTTTALSAARAVQYGAIALGVGAVVFLALCWVPGLAEVAGGSGAWQVAAAAFARRMRALLIAAGLAGALSAALAIGLQGANAAGTSLWAALDTTVIADVLRTRFGAVWGVGLAAWLGVLGLAVARVPPLPALRPASVGATGLAPPARRNLLPLALPLALVCALPGLGGHASVQHPVALLLPANVIHVVATAAWLGGIAVLVLALRAATRAVEGDERLRLLGAVVGRFSAMAGLAIAAILATGIAQSVVYVESFRNLIDTAFGRVVLIKLVLFAGICALGFANRSRVLPRLRGAQPSAAAALLRRTLRAELAIGVAVIAATGALAGYAPSTAQMAGPFSGSAIIGPARVEVTVDPATVGSNELHFYLFDRTDGRQYDAPDELTVTARLPSKGVEPITLAVSKAGPGHYTVPAATLGLAGDWTLEIGARVGEFDLYTAKLDVPVE